jgi:hypothetical protein
MTIIAPILRVARGLLPKNLRLVLKKFRCLPRRLSGGRPRHFERISLFAQWRPDWLAGHVGLELANPSASYLIGNT